MNKEEKQAWLDEQGIDLIKWGEETEYYEAGKPFSKKNWKKLIDDLNNLLTNPPGNCSAIEPIEIQEPQIWSAKHVTEVRDKVLQMCGINRFDWGWYLPDWEGSDEEKNLLVKSWGREIIYEIGEQLNWCNCGVTIITEESLNKQMVCPGCGYPDFEEFNGTIGEVYGGMEVGPSNQIGRRWQYGHYVGPTDNDFSAQASGPVSCEGFVEDELHWMGYWNFDVKTRQEAIPVRFQSPYCDGRWPCEGTTAERYAEYAENIAAEDPWIMQFRIINEGVEFKDCEET